MKTNKTTIAVVVGVIVVIFVVVVAGLNMTPKSPIPTNTNTGMATQNLDLKYTFNPTKTSYKVGDKIELPLYLNGNDAGRVTAFDIKFAYDATKLKLNKVNPGLFLPKYLTVKWDLENSWFALALSPSTPKPTPDPSAAVMTLEFTALAKTSSTQVSTGVSTVYVSKTGGAHPQTGTATLTIN